MINFYRKFIKDAALILAPLTNALKGPDKLLVWSSSMESAFLQEKHLLSAVPTLVHPAPDSAVSVAVDASEYEINPFKIKTQQYLPHCYSFKGFKGMLWTGSEMPRFK